MTIMFKLCHLKTHSRNDNGLHSITLIICTVEVIYISTVLLIEITNSDSYSSVAYCDY